VGSWLQKKWQAPAGATLVARVCRPLSAQTVFGSVKQENVSEWAWLGSPSRRHVLRRPFIETDASQGAGRTISGYDILPRIQGHAQAKPCKAVSMAPDATALTQLKNP